MLALACLASRSLCLRICIAVCMRIMQNHADTRIYLSIRLSVFSFIYPYLRNVHAHCTTSNRVGSSLEGGCLLYRWQMRVPMCGFLRLAALQARLEN